MSLCDKCYAPGSCCKRLSLSLRVPDGVDPAAKLATFPDDGPNGRLSQFVPVEIDMIARERGAGGNGADYWLWNCTALGSDGRCTIYEDRPHLCREYQPLQDGLCVHFGGAEGDERAAL